MATSPCPTTPPAKRQKRADVGGTSPDDEQASTRWDYPLEPWTPPVFDDADYAFMRSSSPVSADTIKLQDPATPYSPTAPEQWSSNSSGDRTSYPLEPRESPFFDDADYAFMRSSSHVSADADTIKLQDPATPYSPTAPEQWSSNSSGNSSCRSTQQAKFGRCGLSQTPERAKQANKPR